MSRPRGGYIGFNRVPAATAVNSAASGIWTLREAEALKRAGTWPTLSDANFANVSLLLHMDGSNGSTAFTDSSSSAVAVVANGGAAISTAQSKFGGSSAYFNAQGDYLSASGSAVSLAGVSAFTVEGWFFFADATANAIQMMFVTYDAFSSGALFFGKHTDSAGRVTVFANGAKVCNETTSPPASTWVHYALVFASGTMTIYRDGVQSASGAVNPTFTGQLARVGGNAEGSGAYRFKGYIDDFRLTKLARYTSAFTPPDAAFPDS